MSVYLRRMSPQLALVSGFLMWFVALGVVRASSPSWPVGGQNLAPVAGFSAQLPQGPPGATNIGDEACLTCHDPEGQTYARSSHHFGSDPRTPAAADGCETCHGPGSVHATADDPALVPILNPKELPVDELNTLCLSCHTTSEHVLWQGSQHEARGLACTSCHSQHSSGEDTKLLIGDTQMETCGTCHRDKVAKLDRSGHMPVREGKMECSTCHNPHGSTNVRLLSTGDSVAELCTSCHAEKRGPFLWEHAPARDGCVSCHDPHGSANDRMLVARTPILCQRCHVAAQHPATIYDAGLLQTNAHVYARSCVMCHANIHGSNHPGGSRFIR
jgi:DmsE family decaheme c-type cytochrome